MTYSYHIPAVIKAVLAIVFWAICMAVADLIGRM